MTKKELLISLYCVKRDVELLITALHGCCPDEDYKTVKEVTEGSMHTLFTLHEAIIEMSTGEFKNDAILL